jgi:hypothetical protein
MSRRWRDRLVDSGLAPLGARRSSTNGQKLWGRQLGGAIGGGVITYTANGAQKVAVATGFTSVFWPTEVVTGKIVILGLGDAAASQ